MDHYFVWKAKKVPEERVPEIKAEIESNVSRCVEMHRQLPKLRIEVWDGPMSLDGEATTEDSQTIVRFTYSHLRGGSHTYQYCGSVT